MKVFAVISFLGVLLAVHAAQWKGVSMRGVTFTTNTGNLITNQIDAYQNYRGGVVGDLVTVAALQSSFRGTGNVFMLSNAALTNTASIWRYTNGPDLLLARPIKVANEVHHSTGTNWIYWQANFPAPYEAICIGYADLRYTNVIVQGYFQVNLTNNHNADINIDHVQLQGSPFTIIQQHFPASGGGPNFKAHAGNGNGGTLSVPRGRPIFWKMRVHYTNRLFWCRFYDVNLGYRYLGQSQTSPLDTNYFGLTQVQIQGNYLNQTNTFVGNVLITGTQVIVSNVADYLAIPL
jgi:hypothetical protein